MNPVLRHMLPSLRCPVTKGPLRELTDDEAKNLNDRIHKGWVRHYDGSTVAMAVDEGFASADGRHIYAVVDGIAILMDFMAIMADSEAAREIKTIRGEKAIVQRFYDEFGWTHDSGGFHDATAFEDLRPVSEEYRRRCHLRVNRHLSRPGDYLVDVASGPVQYDEYLSYSKDYAVRVCVDISMLALKEARRKLGDRGVYILGDITNLPFADGFAEGVISLHTIYHVPADEQHLAFLEIHRILKPASSAVIVYGWGDGSTLMRICMAPAKGWDTIVGVIKAPLIYSWTGRSRFLKACVLPYRALCRILGLTRRLFPERPLPLASPPLYGHSFDIGWFDRQPWSFKMECYPWRSVSISFLRRYVHARLAGRALLRLVFSLEDRFPRFLGRHGAYPLFVIWK